MPDLNLDFAGSAQLEPAGMADPFALFDEWFAKAQASEPNDPNAMALATADWSETPAFEWCY